MDNSGKNRYELLFMDDDISDPLDNLVKKKVKQPAATGTNSITSGGQQQHQTKSVNSGKQNADNLKKNSAQLSSEKENKSLAMNKNLDNRKSAGNNATSGGGNISSSGGGGNSGGGSIGPATKTLGGNKSGQQYQQQHNYQQQQGQQFSNNHQNINRSNRDNGSTTARSNNIKQQNGETREQRNNRRNRENGVPGTMGGIGEYTTESQQRIRQNNQRFSGPPRNRNANEGIRGGKREFDRQSGSDKTGVKAVDKRDGAGAHNWGSVKQDIEDINKSNDEAGFTDKEESGNDQTADQNATIEEETKELTLDEWKAQRQQRAKPQFNIRKAGEGEDVTQWKKMVALNNKKKEGDSEEELEYDPSMYPQRVGRLQRVLDIQFHFNDGRRGGGGLGRGRGRGPRTIGGSERPIGGGGNVGIVGTPGGRPDGLRANVGRPRNDNPRREAGIDRQQRGGQHAPKVDDERQFPTLS